MWNWIKKFFDFNKDKKVTTEDLKLLRDLAETNIKASNEKINEIKKEIDDVVVATKVLVKETKDVVNSVKGKKTTRNKTK